MLRRTILSLILAASAAHAGQIVLSGTLTADDDIAWIPFSVPVSGTVSIRTLSYASGGFDPVLSLFDAAGLQPLLASNEDAPGTCGVDNPADISTGLCLDSALSLALPAGAYSLAITESFNYPLGPFLSSGFLMDGAGNFTGGPFLDVTGSQRTGDWVVQLNLPDPPAPEPGSLLLSSAALLALSLRRYRKSV